MKLTSFICLVCVAMPISASALDFKGVTVGEKADVNLIWQTFHAARDNNWIGETTIAGANAEVILSVDDNDIVTMISTLFDSEHSPDVESAVISKFGKAKSRTLVPLRNGFGARLDSILETWVGSDGSQATLVSQLNATKGAFTISSKSKLVEDKKRHDASVNDL